MGPSLAISSATGVSQLTYIPKMPDTMGDPSEPWNDSSSIETRPETFRSSLVTPYSFREMPYDVSLKTLDGLLLDDGDMEASPLQVPPQPIGSRHHHYQQPQKGAPSESEYSMGTSYRTTATWMTVTGPNGTGLGERSCDPVGETTYAPASTSRRGSFGTWNSMSSFYTAEDGKDVVSVRSRVSARGTVLNLGKSDDKDDSDVRSMFSLETVQQVNSCDQLTQNPYIEKRGGEGSISLKAFKSASPDDAPDSTSSCRYDGSPSDTSSSLFAPSPGPYLFNSSLFRKPFQYPAKPTTTVSRTSTDMDETDETPLPSIVIVHHGSRSDLVEELDLPITGHTLPERDSSLGSATQSSSGSAWITVFMDPIRIGLWDLFGPSWNLLKEYRTILSTSESYPYSDSDSGSSHRASGLGPQPLRMEMYRVYPENEEIPDVSLASENENLVMGSTLRLAAPRSIPRFDRYWKLGDTPSNGQTRGLFSS
ncbi:hypothetical protein BD324DRAFT_409536 [Kockovaella imperatae]|uniref:Uncharacterized protein n=1 Tax=Kockovaella imperatae TaxID=4999 RepID=A0A1Y1UKB2_9TREE|nr:hypothetical protein BD324DRAFT_409536 [Kockovaella imperatae]ORX37944.1 hypothetical protein BD324DRAFT_409536 [Kockovaella imperatae]